MRAAASRPPTPGTRSRVHRAFRRGRSGRSLLRGLLPALALPALLLGCGETPELDEPATEEPDSAAAAEAPPPATDLWLVELEAGDDGIPVLAEPVNLTGRPAYDNQPFFLDDGRIVYTAARDDGTTDPHLMELESGESSPILETPETSEYSPTPVPGRGIVVVRVEEDGTTQRLWNFDPDEVEPGDRAELLVAGLEPVGYQGWLDPDRVAVYVLGSPASLHLAEVDTGFTQLVFEGIGPSIQAIPGEVAVSFVEVAEDGSRWIRRFDGTTGETSRIVQAPEGAGADHAWTPGGVLLISTGRELHAFRPGTDRGWQSLGEPGPGDVEWSRIAVSPSGNRMVLVGTSP